MLAIKKRKNAPKSFSLKKKNYNFLHISSCYVKILGETNFQPLEFPRSGLKAKDGEEKKRGNDGNNNGQLCIANAPSGGARKAAWANVWPLLFQLYIFSEILNFG